MKRGLIFVGILLATAKLFGQESSIQQDSVQAIPADSMIIQHRENTTAPVFKHSLGELNIKLDESGSRFMKFNLNSQVWLRSIENNPGTLVNGVQQSHTTDAGLRRMRVTLKAQLSSAYHIYVQLGINNQSFIAGGGSGTGANGQGKKPQIFFMDAFNEYEVIPKINSKTNLENKFHLSLGAGLHGVNGISRLSNASTAKFLMADLPVFNYPNIEVSDQFARQFGVFARGEWNHLNYRFAVNKPFATNQQPEVGQTVDNNQSGKLSYSGYVAYNFLDKDDTSTIFFSGNNLGTKKMLNLGVGFYNANSSALSQIKEGEFKSHDQSVLSADIYADLPVGNPHKEMAFNVYSVFYRYNFGPHYLRNTGIMNPGTIDPNYDGTLALEGAGNGRNLLGTGNMWYTQAGFLLPKFSDKVKLQPFASYTLKDLDGLNEVGHYYDLGANLFILSQSAKITYQYSSRPLYDRVNKEVFDRKGEHILMLQIAF